MALSLAQMKQLLNARAKCGCPLVPEGEETTLGYMSRNPDEVADYIAFYKKHPCTHCGIKSFAAAVGVAVKKAQED